mmetsp:Transcript_88692/g.264627  ORF Transcript_88692/g.264627 Transcript_88692/m.264627 type:complete len:387 (-) Transcript_88692:3-1163(-)
MPLIATTRSPTATGSLPADGPPTHKRFQESMAPPGLMARTCSALSAPDSLYDSSRPSATPSARRNVKPNLQPPSSHKTIGDAGTAGDFIGVEVPSLAFEPRCDCGVLGGVSSMCCDFVGERPGVAARRAAAGPSRTRRRGGEGHGSTKSASENLAVAWQLHLSSSMPDLSGASAGGGAAAACGGAGASSASFSAVSSSSGKSGSGGYLAAASCSRGGEALPSRGESKPLAARRRSSPSAKAIRSCSPAIARQRRSFSSSRRWLLSWQRWRSSDRSLVALACLSTSSRNLNSVAHHMAETLRSDASLSTWLPKLRPVGAVWASGSLGGWSDPAPAAWIRLPACSDILCEACNQQRPSLWLWLPRFTDKNKGCLRPLLPGTPRCPAAD